MVNSMSSAQIQDAARAVARLDAGGHVFHKPKSASYASGCNGKAIMEQSRKPHIVGIDLDFNPNKEETPWVHHQLHPTKRDAWFDPQHKIGDARSCREMDNATIRRLHVRYKGAARPILHARRAAVIADQAGIIPCFEAKFTSPLYLDPQWWFDHFVLNWAGAPPVIMSLPGTRGGRTGLAKLAAAHEVGLPTMWLWRGQPPAGYSKHVDLVKSRPGRGIYRVGA